MTQVEAGAPGFAVLQQRLGAAWEANRPGSTVPHVVVALWWTRHGRA
jgi:hypothetical protein